MRDMELNWLVTRSFAPLLNCIISSMMHEREADAMTEEMNRF